MIFSIKLLARLQEGTKYIAIKIKGKILRIVSSTKTSRSF